MIKPSYKNEPWYSDQYVSFPYPYYYTHHYKVIFGLYRYFHKKIQIPQNYYEQLRDQLKKLYPDLTPK